MYEKIVNVEAYMDEDARTNIFDLEANLSEDGEVTIFLNKHALEHLIEQLVNISQHKKMGGHIHLDYDSGLEGNIRSIVIIRR